MRFAALATPLTLLAVALPFLFCFTQPPLTNFWPLVASGACAVVLAGLALLRSPQRSSGCGMPAPGAFPAGAPVSADHLAWGLVCAALVASGVGLLQYFLGDPGMVGVQPSTPGQAIGNLRQRNQQASLLSMGVWAVLWLQAGGAARSPDGRSAVAAGAGLALLALGSAATASRTGGLQWLMVVALAWRWPAARRFALAALAFYALAAGALPMLLQAGGGGASEGLFKRFLGEQADYTSRTVLWSNVVHLIAQKPWTGWGWGELDYAHYVTLFPGRRFSVLLDNAHNLPLQLAVELGLPAAVLLCGGVLLWVVRRAPWRECQPAQQLAWGILAIVGVHSLLEFPLWYGPFQLVVVLSVWLLCAPSLPRWLGARAVRAGVAGAAVAAVALGVQVGWDFYRVSQLYRPVSERAAAFQSDTARKVADVRFFRDQVDFARLTTTEVTPGNAEWVFGTATRLLHFSPEPRVIEPLIQSARLLGQDEVAIYHRERYRIAYPDDYARWNGRAAGVADTASSFAQGVSAGASAPASLKKATTQAR